MRRMQEKHMDANPEQGRTLPLARWSHTSVRHRVVNHLADIILHADDIMEMLRGEEATQELREVESCVHAFYGSISSVITSLCD